MTYYILKFNKSREERERMGGTGKGRGLGGNIVNIFYLEFYESKIIFQK